VWRRPPCCQAVREMQLDLPDPLPPELSTRHVTVMGGTARQEPYKEQLSPEDFHNINICRRVDGDMWLKVHAWGTKSGELNAGNQGIAHTLPGYATAGWDKGPSPKQARHGVVILETAERAGIIGRATIQQK
jgi:hypothetical protein